MCRTSMCHWPLASSARALVVNDERVTDWTGECVARAVECCGPLYSRLLPEC